MPSIIQALLSVSVLLAAQLAVAAQTSFVEDKLAGKPNVLLIVADDLGLQLSCYGDKHIHTPNIDALAASGARFKTAYIAQLSCSPSRASIFTGLFPHTHGHLGLAKPHNLPFDLNLNASLGPNGAREVRAMADAADRFIAADPARPFFLNLAADPAHAATLKRMQGLLLAWRQQTQDPFLNPAALEKKHAEVNERAASPTPIRKESHAHTP